MVASDFLPGDFFVGPAQPKEPVCLNQYLLGREMNLLWNESSPLENGWEQVCFHAERFNGGDPLVPREVVAAARALRGFMSRHLRAFWTAFTNYSSATVAANVG